MIELESKCAGFCSLGLKFINSRSQNEKNRVIFCRGELLDLLDRENARQLIQIILFILSYILRRKFFYEAERKFISKCTAIKTDLRTNVRFYSWLEEI